MTERKVSVRLGIIGGKEVEAQFEQLGTRGATAMKRLGDNSEQAFGKVARSSGSGKFALQNVGFQVQDFAVQVGGGTSATQALAQQLPQLLSGLGLFGVLAGTAAAILIPLGAAIFSMGGKAVDASKQIETLVGKINELKAANAVYSSEGIDQLVSKYGELNAAVLLLIERQQRMKETAAFDAAKATVASIGQDLDEVNSLLEAYDNLTAAGADDARWGPDAQSWKEEIENLGMTVDQARALMVALDAVRNAQTIPEMADATAQLTTLLEGTTFAGGELEQQLLDAEDALRQLKAQGDGVNSWLDAAIAGAYDFATQLWDGARAAAAIRAAQAKTPTQEQMDRASYGAGQVALRDRMINDRAMYGGNSDGLTPEEYDRINPKARTGATRTGAGGGSQTNALEQEAQRIFEGTRTEAEKYATELARLEQIKSAGLITNDTYNRQLEVLATKYGQVGGSLAGLQTKLQDFAKGTADIASGIGDSLVAAFESASDAIGEFAKTGKLDFSGMISSFLADFAKLTAQKYIFGPLADMLSGSLDGGSIFGAALSGLLGGGAGGASPTPFATGGVISGPTTFSMRGGAGLMGEAGPEAIMPLTSVGGKLGVRAAGNGGTIVQINNYSGAPVREERSRGPDGRETVRVVVGEEIARGSFDGANRSRYGSAPQKVRR